MKICFSNLDYSLISEYYTRCCINTILPPDDEYSVARNMYRIKIINVLYNVIVHQVGNLPRVTPGCTVSKHVQDYNNKRLIQRNCASSWLFTQSYTRMHGQQNIQLKQ